VVVPLSCLWQALKVDEEAVKKALATRTELLNYHPATLAGKVQEYGALLGVSEEEVADFCLVSTVSLLLGTWRRESY
jgi:hypothetical protein